MVFDIGETNSCEETSEVINAVKDFRDNYNLNEKNVNYIITKQSSDIAPYFLIYPKSDKVEIKNLSPIKLNSSYIENLLMDNEKESIILLNGRYFRILKQKPEDLKD
ncbi:MAG: hypothetical protein NTZ83_00665 [Candidatus Pacearchaeota archaeon]|nr:hypothetical protein [Candidatus Pacearchaeota archaeon]